MENKFFNYSGAIHIHTNFSDGSGDINEISMAAKKAGLDWIIITDHNSLDIEEGFYNGVCVIKGEEISPQNSNHYLAFDINKNICPHSDPNVYIEKVRKQGGFGFAAHPDESDNRKNKAKPIKWTDKSIIPDGIEIWNWFSDWADNYDETNIFTIAYGYLFRHRLVKGPHIETLKWWDELNSKSEKLIPAIAGVDAHALKIFKYIVPVTVFSYECSFKTLTNVITLRTPLPHSFDGRKKVILQAIKDGNNIIVNRHIKNAIPQIFLSGEHIFVRLSFNAQIRLIYNGMLIFTKNAKSIEFYAQTKGSYRVEIFLNNKPWVYSNPINVI